MTITPRPCRDSATERMASSKLASTKVAPANYQRTSAVITKNMVAKASAKLQELGKESALKRRFARIERALAGVTRGHLVHHAQHARGRAARTG